MGNIEVYLNDNEKRLVKKEGFKKDWREMIDRLRF